MWCPKIGEFGKAFRMDDEANILVDSGMCFCSQILFLGAFQEFYFCAEQNNHQNL